jgi:hypothetical protein
MDPDDEGEPFVDDDDDDVNDRDMCPVCGKAEEDCECYG